MSAIQTKTHKIFLRIDPVFLRLVRYSFVGGVAALMALITSISLFRLGWFGYSVSQAIGFVLGTVINYPLSRWWAFKNHYKVVPVQFTVFSIVSLLGLSVNEITLKVTVSIFHWWVPLGMACGLLIAFGWNFTIHNWLTFGKLS